MSQIKNIFKINLLPKFSRKPMWWLGLLMVASAVVKSQCVKLPYQQDFEVNDGGWTTGGIASDWEWGAPSKSMLTAVNGKNCWTTGGLTKSSYNDDELAWLQTPCFDFSNVQHPYVLFRFFLNTEKHYDGATFEYSTDNGISWITVGDIYDPMNCLNWNWYNASNIKYVNNGVGWSGSTYWIWANHTIPLIAGKSNVKFRFLFGAGNINNNYNGFAVDDFFAGEADSTDASFTYKCTTSNTVDFSVSSFKGCPDYSWDFGDPATGLSDTSHVLASSHTYSAPGKYKVTLSTVGPGNAPSTSSQFITILKSTVSVISQPTCFGSKKRGRNCKHYSCC